MPMPTPEYEEHLNYMRRAGRRADGEKQTPDRSHAARDTSGVRPDLPDPRVLAARASIQNAAHLHSRGNLAGAIREYNRAARLFESLRERTP